MNDGVTIITDIGARLIRDAAGDASAVAITHIALGDGLGAAYTPAHDQASLRRELARKPIERRYALGDDSWHAKAVFPANTPAFKVREAGFFDAQGRMIALWAGLDILDRQTGAMDYLIDHVLNFSRVESGLVIVAAPDEELFDFALIQLRNQANTAHATIKLHQRLKTLEARA